MATLLGTPTAASGTLTLSWTLVAGSNRIVECTFSEEWGGGTKPTNVTVTYGGVTAEIVSQVDREAGGGGIWRAVVREADLPANGAHNWVWNPTGGSGEQGREVIATAAQDADQSGPEVHTVQSSGGGTNLAFSLNHGDSAFAVGTCHSNGAGTWTPPTGWTERFDVDVGGGDDNHTMADEEFATAGTPTATFVSSNSGAGKCGAAAVYENASAAAPVSPHYLSYYQRMILETAA